MKKRHLLIILMMIIMTLPNNIYAGTDGNGSENIWLPEDFTYEDTQLAIGETGEQFKLYPISNMNDVLTGTIHIVTGLSDSGESKLELNKNLVIPAQDPDGNVVQGIGNNAFKNIGVTSVTFPENIKTYNNGKWDESVNKRGDFFIGYYAFSDNQLTELILPEGVIFVDAGAFKNNYLTSVSFPSTLMVIGSQSFGNNNLNNVIFTSETDFPLQIDNNAFANNKLKEVYLPERTEKVTKYAFFQNTGMEPVLYGTEEEKRGGIVYFHITNPGKYIEDITTNKSNVQKLIAEYTDLPEEEDDDNPNEWLPSDFTYDDFSQRLYGCDYTRDFTVSGTAISGFSDSGEEKLLSNTDLVIPAKDTDGNTIVGIGNNAFSGKGLTSVKFPSGMLVNYDDKVTYRITKRGNFVIGNSAFSNNELSEVTLPDGVIAVMSYAFNGNNLTSVTLPKTIWWLETMSFANNQISKVKFPETTYFQFEMHGMPFGENQIKSVRLPDYTAVVNKHSFIQNPGMEKMSDAVLRQAYPGADADKISKIKKANQNGIVYMYTDNISMSDMDRIHHVDKTTGSTHSYFQKLIINDGTPETQNPDDDSWNINDFTVSGTVITGLSSSGIEKRKTKKDLVIPDYNSEADLITEIAAAPAEDGGLFASSSEKFDSVTLPSGLKKIGNNAFRESGISEIAFPPELEEIGIAAFQNNNLTSVILPDTVTSLGEGAFATNMHLERVILSSGLEEIPTAAFGCSDAKHWMKKLTEITIPYGIKKIGDRAFAGNNFREIIIPEGVTEIGQYAFSTKNYLLLENSNECRVVLPDSLKKLGNRAFRNKKIESIVLPRSLELLGNLTFEKVLSTYGDPNIPGSTVYDLKTTVYIKNREQFEDKDNFYDTKHHKIVFTGFEAWQASDFTYAETEINGEELNMVTGLSASGTEKLDQNKELALPLKDENDKVVVGVAANAFEEKGFTALSIPEGYVYICNSAFKSNELTNIELPEGVSKIGKAAFSANRLNTVSFPESIRNIDEEAFSDNNITGLRFTETTLHPVEIESGSFANNKIKSVQLPAGTEKVAADAFEDNTGKGGVVSMYILEPGDNIAHVSNGTSSVQKLVADEDMPADDVWQIDDFEYSVDGTTIMGFSEYGLDRLSVTHDVVLPDLGPEGVEILQISKEAFAVSEADIDVGKYDFTSTNGLTSVVLPKHLKIIGDRAFEYNSLKTIDFSVCKDLEKIGTSAFHGNKLREVRLPDSVYELGDGVFAANNIKRLELSKSVERIPQGAFSMNIRLETITIPDTVTEIGEMAFAGARLTSLNIPSSVSKIDRKAFHLHHLKTLTVPGTVKYIGESAFEGTYKAQTLKNLTLGEGIEYIGKYAFKEGLLTKVRLPYSLKSMGYEPFVNNTGAESGHVVILSSYNKAHLAFNENAKYHRVIDQTEEDAKAKAKARAEAEAKAKKIKTVTVNTTSVNAKAVDKAVAKAGGSSKYVTKIVLGKNVKIISKNTFKKYNKVKTLEVKTKKLKKKNVKGSLKGSKVTTVKVKVGKTKANKQYVKKYKKIFTKKNAGKKVKVK